MNSPPLPDYAAGPISDAADLSSPGFRQVAPGILRAETTPLVSLIHHRESLDAGTLLEVAHRIFCDCDVKFMAVTRDQRVIGLCARGEIGFLMGSRFGFALYSKNPVSGRLVQNPMMVRSDAPMRELLETAMARQGDKFHEDIALVDPDARLLGLIPVQALAQVQTQLVLEQLEEMRQQQERLRTQNLDLFRAFHALRQSQGLYVGLFESHMLGVALIDRRGRIHAHNGRLLELFGLADAPASIVSLAEWVVENERAGFLLSLEAQADGAITPMTREFTLHSPSKGPRLFRVSTGWIRETGQICACLDDITDQRSLERAMLQQEKQNLLDTLVGGVAHELNNKLTPVMGFADLLEAQVSGPVAHYAGIIRKSVEEAAAIIRQMLQLSRPSAPLTQVIDVRWLVDEALSMLRFQMRDLNCEAMVRHPDEPIGVLADPGELKQVVINLVLNALHAMAAQPQPRLQVATAVRGRTATLVVVDNGCGIPAAHLGRIFDPFFSTKGPEKGSGLGLSICHSLVRQHGGQIHVESTEGAGAKFTVLLPVNSECHRPDHPREIRAQPTEAPNIRAPRQHVLVVDDEQTVQRLMQEMLRTAFGCDVDLASNGSEALLALEQVEYALIVSDIRMPVCSGTELYRRVLQRWPRKAQRFVFITGYPGGRDSQDEIAQWNVPVIAKPFTMARMIEVCGPILHGA